MVDGFCPAVIPLDPDGRAVVPDGWTPAGWVLNMRRVAKLCKSTHIRTSAYWDQYADRVEREKGLRETRKA